MGHLFEFLIQFLRERRREASFAVFVFLVASASFMLGYLTAREFVKTPIIIEKAGEGS